MNLKHISTAVAALMIAIIAFAQPAHAQTTITFEGLNDSTPVTTQYSAQGVTFTNATAITAGVSLNETEFPPHSGSNVVYDDGGSIGGVFSVPVYSLSGYFTFTSPLTFTAYNSAGNEIASVNSLYADNTVSSGNAPNEFLQLTSLQDISSFTISGDPAGGSFTLDDLTFSQNAPVAPTPEPSPAVSLGVLLLLTLATLSLRLRPGRLLNAVSRLKNPATLSKILPCAIVASIGFLATPAHATRSISTPTASADYALVNTPRTVTITAKVAPDPQLITTAVRLVRVNLSGTVLGTYPMYDDGTHGDKTARDGTYTAQVSLNEQAPGSAIYYVTSAYTNTLLRTKSDALNLRVVVNLTTAQINEYVNTLDEAGNKYSALLQTEPATQARADLVSYLLTLPDVSSATITPDGTTVAFLMFTNLEEDVETDLFNSNGSIGSNSEAATFDDLAAPLESETVAPVKFGLDSSTYSPVVSNKTALVIAAYHDQFAPPAGPGDEADPISSLLRGIGYEPDYLPSDADNPGNATVDVLKTMSNYGIVIITSHGYYNNGYATYHFLGYSIYSVPDVGVNIDTREQSTFISTVYHLHDVRAGFIVPIQQGAPDHLLKYWAITPGFVKKYVHWQPSQNPIVYVGGCFSLYGFSMANAFTSNGASVYFGYDEGVLSKVSYADGVDLFNVLTLSTETPDKRTVAIAYKYAKLLETPPNNPQDPGILATTAATSPLALDIPNIVSIDHIVAAPTSPTAQVAMTTQLTGTAYDAQNNIVSVIADELQWSSSNTAVATVDANNGVVTGKSVGIATVTVTDTFSGKSASVLVTVGATYNEYYNSPAITSTVNGMTVTCPALSGTATLTFLPYTYSSSDQGAMPGDNISGTIILSNVNQEGSQFYGTLKNGMFTIRLAAETTRIIMGTMNSDGTLNANTMIDCVYQNEVIGSGPLYITPTQTTGNGSNAINQAQATNAPCASCAKGHHRRF